MKTNELVSKLMGMEEKERVSYVSNELSIGEVNELHEKYGLVAECADGDVFAVYFESESDRMMTA